MRIIAGDAKGRRLKTLPGDLTRPTTDKVRGAIFSSLGSVEGMRVLDAFGGSGALGLEALSRGADFAMFVEQNRRAMAMIRGNIEILSFSQRAETVLSDFRKVELSHVEAFDVIFLDPPYGQGLVYEAMEQILAMGLLKKDGIVVVETGTKVPEVFTGAGFRRVKEKQYGDTQVNYYILEN